MASKNTSNRLPSCHFIGGGGGGIDMLEYPFITLKTFPPGFLHRLGKDVIEESLLIAEV